MWGEGTSYKYAAGRQEALSTAPWTACQWLRNGPLENLWGGGGGRSTKKLFAQGKIKWKKIHARQLTLKIFMLWPKKIHTRNLITKKIPAARKFPTPTITFLMVRPLVTFLLCINLIKPFNYSRSFLKWINTLVKLSEVKNLLIYKSLPTWMF